MTVVGLPKADSQAKSHCYPHHVIIHAETECRHGGEGGAVTMPLTPFVWLPGGELLLSDLGLPPIELLLQLLVTLEESQAF